MSQVSWCGGPPCCQIKMTFLTFALRAAFSASARRTAGSVSPERPTAPRRSTSRREKFRQPEFVNMERLAPVGRVESSRLDANRVAYRTSGLEDSTRPTNHDSVTHHEFLPVHQRPQH